MKIETMERIREAAFDIEVEFYDSEDAESMETVNALGEMKKILQTAKSQGKTHVRLVFGNTEK